MAQLLPIVFLGIIYAVWLWLDSMQLPNTISIVLIGLVVICGGFWAFYKFSADPRRKKAVALQQKRLGRELSEEEFAEIQPRSATGEFFASLFGVLFFVTVLRSFLFEPFQIPSGSMEPTLRVGDFVLVNKFNYGIKDPIWQNTLFETGHPQRGDVVVFKAPPQPHVDYIKRVIGVGGDKIKYDFATQHLTVTKANGEVEVFEYSEGKPNPDFFYHGEMQIERTEKGDVTHQILHHPMVFSYAPYFFKQEGQVDGEWLVPAGHYFVMGDNRDNSQDSRFWGFVPEQNIVGKATFIWLSIDKVQDESVLKALFTKGLRLSHMFTAVN